VNRWVAGGIALLGAAVVAVPLAVERVVDQRELIDVRIFDSFTTSILYQSYPHADLINGLELAVGCGLAGMAALLVAQGLGGDNRLLWFFLVTAIGLGALAVEETFELSELVAYKLSIDPKRTDLFLPVLALVYLVAFRRLLLGSRRAIWIGGAGAAVFVSALFVDQLPGVSRLEDPLESLSTLLLLAAFATLVVELLGRSASPREEAIA
jgi:hypothetical protein